MALESLTLGKSNTSMTVLSVGGCCLTVPPLVLAIFKVEFHSLGIVKHKKHFAGTVGKIWDGILLEEKVRILLNSFVVLQRICVDHNIGSTIVTSGIHSGVGYERCGIYFIASS